MGSLTCQMPAGQHPLLPALHEALLTVQPCTTRRLRQESALLVHTASGYGQALWLHDAHATQAAASLHVSVPTDYFAWLRMQLFAGSETARSQLSDCMPYLSAGIAMTALLHCTSLFLLVTPLASWLRTVLSAHAEVCGAREES